jgi:hypothetical protein
MTERFHHFLSLIFVAAFVSLQALSASAQPAASVKTITWDDLLPTHWANEIKLQMAAVGRLGFLVDGSEQANEAMQQLRKKWDNAPIDPTHINSAIRIAGCKPQTDLRISSRTLFRGLHSPTAATGKPDHSGEIENTDIQARLNGHSLGPGNAS